MPSRRRKPKHNSSSDGSKENLDSNYSSKRLFNSPAPPDKITGLVTVYARDLTSPAKTALIDVKTYQFARAVKPPPPPPMPVAQPAPAVPRFEEAPLLPAAPLPAVNEPQCTSTLPPMFVFNKPYCSAWWIQACRSDLAATNAQMAPLGILGPTLDPFCPLVTMLMLNSAVLGGHIVLGAHRWMQLVHSDDWLWEAASAAGVISCPIYCPLPTPGSSPGSSPVWIDSWEEAPINFYNAPKDLIMLFLACVWLEANAADTRMPCGTEWPGMKYPLAELVDWVLAAFGGSMVVEIQEVVTMVQLASGGAYA